MDELLTLERLESIPSIRTMNEAARQSTVSLSYLLTQVLAGKALKILQRSEPGNGARGLHGTRSVRRLVKQQGLA